MDAGFQPDPTGRHPYRWWDGTAWTESVSSDGATTTGLDPLTPAAAPPTAVVPAAAPPSKRTPLLVAGAVVAVVLLGAAAFLLLGGGGVLPDDDADDLAEEVLDDLDLPGEESDIDEEEDGELPFGYDCVIDDGAGLDVDDDVVSVRQRASEDDTEFFNVLVLVFATPDAANRSVAAIDSDDAVDCFTDDFEDFDLDEEDPVVVEGVTTRTFSFGRDALSHFVVLDQFLVEVNAFSEELDDDELSDAAAEILGDVIVALREGGD